MDEEEGEEAEWFEEADAGDVASSLYAKHRTSRSPESIQLCAVLDALLAAVSEQQLAPSATAIFAAALSSLQDAGLRGKGEATAALCSVLGAAAGVAPAAALRRLRGGALEALRRAIKEGVESPGTLRAALPCAGVLLGGAWEGGEGPAAGAAAAQLAASFSRLLLAHATDARPKVRRAAVDAAASCLAGLGGSRAGAACASALQRWAHAPLAAPALASADGDAQREATTAALHALGCVRALLAPLARGPAAAALAADLLRLLQPGALPLVQAQAQMLAASALEALAGLAPRLEGAPAALRLLQQLSALDGEPLAAGGRASLAAAVAAAAAALCEADGEAGSAALSAVAQALARLLRLAPLPAAEALKALLRRCVDARALAAAVRALAGGGSSPLARTCAVLEELLGYRYREAWPSALPVLAVAFERLGPAAAQLLPGALGALAQLADAPDLSCRPQLIAAIAAALRSVGAERVLALLPLDLGAACDAALARMSGDEGEGELAGNAWLLPLLQQHAPPRGRLALFTEAILPAARALEARARAARAKGHAFEAQAAAALERRVWDILPAFATQPEDAAEAFPQLARVLGEMLSGRADLAPPVHLALQRLLAGGEGEEGAACAAAACAYARNFLPILFNAFVAEAPGARGATAATVRAFAAAAGPAQVGPFFRVVLKKLLAVTQPPADGAPALEEGGATRSARRCTFMELLLALCPGLGEAERPLLRRLVLSVLPERDAALQKRAYKLALWLAEAEAEVGGEAALAELLTAAQDSAAACLPAARHHRLRLLALLLPRLRLGEAGQDARAPLLLAELLLATKESGTKARVAAYELLVQLTRGLEERCAAAGGAAGDGARRLFSLVLAGLAGGSPAMVSASLMAASRLVYEFSASLVAAVPQLLPACLALLRATNREVVKAALGFVKVAAVRLPVAMLLPHLDAMVPGLLLWEADSKNRFRAKVRAVLERLVRRLGAQAVAAAAPAEHAALVAHIRKEQAREERRRKAGGSLSEGGAGGGGGGGAARSERAPTRAASRWDADEVFSRGGGSARTALTNRAAARAEARMPTHLRLSRSSEPLDLMDEQAMRGMLRSESAGRSRGGGIFDDEDDEPAAYERSGDGRMVITDEGYGGGRKREREDVEEDGRSQGGASRSTRAPSKSGASMKRMRTGASLHSAAAFRAKKGGAKGDVSHTGVQPYAYWSLDAKLLNRRAGRRREAARGLDKVVSAVKHATKRR